MRNKTLIDKWIDFSCDFEPLFPELFGKRVQIRIVDDQLAIQKIQDVDSGIPITFTVGTILPQNSGPDLALKENKVIKRLVDKSHYGVELRTINIPLQDRSGCISLTYNVDLQSTVANSLNNIAASAEQITAFSEEINQKASLIAKQFTVINQQMEQASKQNEDMRKVLAIVKNITEHLKLISLNALIEAAHAGDHGSGFAVVAREVRKLSESTQQQMVEIHTSIDLMVKSMAEIDMALSQIDQDILYQSTSSQDIFEAIKMVSSSINELKEITDELLGMD